MVYYFLLNGGKHYGTSFTRQRHDHARGQSSNTAIASFERAVEPNLWDQSQDCFEVEKTLLRRGSQNRPERATINCSQLAGGSDYCRLSPSYTVAAG